jgi:sodium transport system permease protein
LGHLDAVVQFEPGDEGQAPAFGVTRVTIHYDETEFRSAEAARRIEGILEKAAEDILIERLNAHGLPAELARPIELERVNVAPPSKAPGAILGSLMPLIMIVMLGIGAFYPAIDLTAGEKERGTFETLLSTPASSVEILGGKFLTVFCVSMLTGLTNLGSMVATFAFQLIQLEEEIGRYHVKLPAGAVSLILAALVPLALFISAVMMSIAVLARSFREAQSLLTPFLILLLFPAAVAAVPGVQLSSATMWVPVANFGLLMKGLMTEHAGWHDFVVVVISTTGCAAVALWIAVRVFQREEVVLAGDRGIPLTLRRSQFLPRPAPTPGMALTLYALCMVLFFYIGAFLQNAFGLAGVAISQFTVFLLPTVLVLWFLRIDLRNALSLRLPSAAAMLGTTLMALGWVPLLLQLGVWQQRVFPVPPEVESEMARLLDLENTPLLVLLAVIAVTPAICEEALFRGALLSGLRDSLRPWALFLIIGIAFGAAHLLLHRVALTALSGIILTYIVWQSRSIIAGAVAHFLINASSLLLETGYVPNAASDLMARMTADGASFAQACFPIWLLSSAAVSFAAGVIALTRSQRSH